MCSSILLMVGILFLWGWTPPTVLNLEGWNFNMLPPQVGRLSISSCFWDWTKGPGARAKKCGPNWVQKSDGGRGCQQKRDQRNGTKKATSTVNEEGCGFSQKVSKSDGGGNFQPKRDQEWLGNQKSLGEGWVSQFSDAKMTFLQNLLTQKWRHLWTVMASPWAIGHWEEAKNKISCDTLMKTICIV